MVAYSFQRQFAPAIRANTKLHTIRGNRRRHARPGEMMQLFTGMRTAHCKKICDDRRCTSVEELRIYFDKLGNIEEVCIAAQPVEDVHAFAVADGFESLAAMSGFWVMQHGLLREFAGVLISWEPALRGGDPNG